MPRLPRIYIEGALYYVTCRGAHEQKLFKEKKDYYMYIELLNKYRKEFEFKLFAYVLLPNHIHLLIEPSSKATISEIMHALNTSYSKYYNSTYQRKGHLFRERFKACLVERGSYLARLTAYIHLNPQRLGLVEEVEGYPYSSLPIYIENKEEFREEREEVLGYLGGESYQTYLNRIGEGPEAGLHKYLRRGILGSKEFVNKMRQLIKEKEEEEERKEEAPSYKKLGWYIGIGAGVSLLALSLSISYLGRKKKEVRTEEVKKIIEPQAFIITKTEDLKDTEWKIKLISMREDKSLADTFTFSKGKFISAYLSEKGFSPSNYSITLEDGKLILETLQSKEGGSASLRAEIENNKMQGVLSIQERESKEDYSFVSLSLRRRR